MRKVLRISSILTGVVSVVSAVVLGCIYLEDIAGFMKKMKVRLAGKLNCKKHLSEGEEGDRIY